MKADDFDDADRGLVGTGVIEEGAVAFLHLYQIELGLMIANAGPGFALGAAFHLLLPRPGAGFGFHQPVGHVTLPT